MGSHGKPRWFPSIGINHHRRASSSSPSPSSLVQNPNSSSSATDSADIPKEFICPISGRLMADPVVVSSGISFERNCIQACKDLNVLPPGVDSPVDLLFPNVNLKSAIFHWCESMGVDRPRSIDVNTAGLFVRDLPGNPAVSSTPIQASIESDLSSDVAMKILAGLKSPQIADQESALLLLRSSARVDNPAQRSALCEDRILQSIAPMIKSRFPSLCLHALAAVVNLSLHQPNRVKIVRAGLIPPLVEALDHNVPEAQDHAVAAIFSLAAEDDNRAAIGVLGALPPLLHLFCKPQIEERTRGDAGMAIYYLSLAGTNVSKLLKLGVVKTFLGFAESGSHGCCGLSLMILRNLAAVREGREAMIEAGAVHTLVEVLRNVNGELTLANRNRNEKWVEMETRREHCVGALYAMSKARMRFKGIAQAAGLEEVIREIEEEEVERDEGTKKRRFREMVRRISNACSGEDDDGGSSSWGSGGDSGSAGDFVGNFSEPILRAYPPSANHGAYTTRF